MNIRRAEVRLVLVLICSLAFNNTLLMTQPIYVWRLAEGPHQNTAMQPAQSP